MIGELISAAVAVLDKTTTGVQSQNYFEQLNLLVCNKVHIFQMPTEPFIFLCLENRSVVL